MKKAFIFIFLVFSMVLFMTGCINKYNVDFDTDGGTLVESQKVEHGTNAIKPIDPIKEGYSFVCWMYEGEVFSFDQPITQSIVLVAKWEESTTVTYKVVYKDSEGTIIHEENVLEGNKANNIQLDDKEGYEFVGWFSKGSLYDFELVVNSNLELVATWSSVGKETFEVKFNDKDGKVISTQVIEKGKDAVAPNIPLVSGYVFVRWDVDFTNVSSNLVVNPIYEIDNSEYNITYNLNGGSFWYKDKDEYVEAFLTDFYKFVAPDVMLRTFLHGETATEGFDGVWKKYIGGSVGDTNRLLSNNDLTQNNDDFFFNSKAYKEKWAPLGQWVKAQNHRFAGDDYTYGALDFYRYIINDPAQYIAVYGDKFYSYPSINFELISKYQNNGVSHELSRPVSGKFVGWHLKEDQSDTAILSLPIGITGDVTLYAEWDTTTTYEIVFNTQGGSSISPITVKYGDVIATLPTPTKDEYKFVGWTLNGVAISIPFEFSNNSSITLVAQWKSLNPSKLENLKYDGKNVYYRNTSTPVLIPSDYVQKEEQMRAVWVSSYAGDFKASSNKTTMMSTLSDILDTLEAMNMNTIIFHIRTHNNAFYKTKLAPIKSEYGTYKTFEEWDYLTWLIEECHSRGIEFHAWLNPYRIYNSGETTMESITSMYSSCPDNPAKDPNNVLLVKNGAILNPAKEEVQDYIVDVCLEVMENYDVDAIHFDDYFYAEMSGGILTQPDKADYEDYIAKNPGSFSPTNSLHKENWRRMNVDNFIQKLHDKMTKFNIANHRGVQLGISPTGIYKNGNGSVESGSNTQGQQHYGSYLFCDTLLWIKNEWIDYILPQSYWAFTHSVAGYADVMDWWDKAVEGTKVNLYSGLGLYMSISGGNYSWGSQQYEFSNQILYTTKLKNVKGISIYAYKSLKAILNNNSQIQYNGVKRVQNEYWTTKVPTPKTMASSYIK